MVTTLHNLLSGVTLLSEVDLRTRWYAVDLHIVGIYHQMCVHNCHIFAFSRTVDTLMESKQRHNLIYCSIHAGKWAHM